MMKKRTLYGLLFLSFIVATQVMRAVTISETEENSGGAQRILLIGDSMLDGLARRFQDYADANGHYLRTVIWYGSTSKHWATTKDLAYHISQEHPTLIIMSLGTNEIGYHDYKTREGYVRKMVETFGDIPFIWIGPVSHPRVKDGGMGAAIERVVGKEHFFDCTTIKMARMKDGVHPTFQAHAMLVDKIAEWINRADSPYSFEFKKPTKHAVLRNYITYKPTYKGRK